MDVVEPSSGEMRTGRCPLLLWATHLQNVDAFEAEAYAFKGTLERLYEFLRNWSAALATSVDVGAELPQLPTG